MRPWRFHAGAAETGIDACAAVLAAEADRVILAGGEGARRLFTAVEGRTPRRAMCVVARDDTGAVALGAAASGARVVLLASGPRWTREAALAHRSLARHGLELALVIPAHGEETGDDLPLASLGDALRLDDVAAAIAVVASPDELSAASAALMEAPRRALVFGLHGVGIRPGRAPSPFEGFERAVRVEGDATAPTAAVALGERLDGALGLARGLGLDAIRGVGVERLRPGLGDALREALRGVREALVLDPAPGALGDEGALSRLTARALDPGARLVAIPRVANDFAYEDPEARDLTLMPLEVRRRLDLVGMHVSLAAWQSLELVVRAAMLRAPVGDGAERAAFAASVRLALDDAGERAQDREPTTRPWDHPDAFASISARASSIDVTVEPLMWATLPDDLRFALAHLAHPKRAIERFHAALRSAGIAR